MPNVRHVMACFAWAQRCTWQRQLGRCAGTRIAVRAFAAQGIDTYLYNFNYHYKRYKDPASNGCEVDSMVGCGVAHTAELRFVFDNFLPAEPEHAYSRSMQKYWTNMAKFGTPNTPGPDAQVPWPKYDEHSDLHLEFTAGGMLNGTALAKQHCDFWDMLPRQGAYPH
jgi:carboxylesterase type B